MKLKLQCAFDAVLGSSQREGCLLLEWVRAGDAAPQQVYKILAARFLVYTARKRYHRCLKSNIYGSWHHHASVTKFERKRRAATAKIARLGPLSTLEFARAGRNA